jgi:hypothetical protein
MLRVVYYPSIVKGDSEIGSSPGGPCLKRTVQISKNEATTK